MNMRRASLLKFCPVEVVCYNTNRVMSTFKNNLDKLLNSVVKVTCTGYWISLNKFPFAPMSFLLFVYLNIQHCCLILPTC